MKHELLLFKDVLPYIWTWTLVIVTLFMMLAYNLWRFGKRHSEIFKADDTTLNRQQLRQKMELRRRYDNKVMTSISIFFIWLIGLVVICSWNGHSSTQGWFVLAFSIWLVIWAISLIQRKPKK